MGPCHSGAWGGLCMPVGEELRGCPVSHHHHYTGTGVFWLCYKIKEIVAPLFLLHVCEWVMACPSHMLIGNTAGNYVEEQFALVQVPSPHLALPRTAEHHGRLDCISFWKPCIRLHGRHNESHDSELCGDVLAQAQTLFPLFFEVLACWWKG